MKKYLEIGKIVASQGIKGEVRVQYFCDSAELFCEFETLYLDGGKTPITVERAFPHKNVVVAKLEGIENPDMARPYIGKMLYADRDELELEDGTYFLQDLIGLEVLDADSGKSYGKLDEIFQNGGADVYSIRTAEGKQLLFPAIGEVIAEVDIYGGKMLINPLNGLFEGLEDENAD